MLKVNDTDVFNQCNSKKKETVLYFDKLRSEEIISVRPFNSLTHGESPLWVAVSANDSHQFMSILHVYLAGYFSQASFPACMCKG